MAGLTQERLKEILDYNPETGEFIWKVRKDVRKEWNTRYAGKLAGYTNIDGYVTIGIDNVLYHAHRLAFLYVTGSFPLDGVDHINGVRGNNRWKNLREADHALNNRSMALSSRSTTGVCGVTFHKGAKKFMVQMDCNGRHFYGGLFSSIEEAGAKAKAMREKHGFAPHHGLSRDRREEFTSADL